MNLSLAIDCRMLFMSGIGRYLREILKRCPTTDESLLFLCNQESQVQWLQTHFRSPHYVLCNCKIYGLSEQIQIPWLVRRAKVIWTPHYNVPLFARANLVVTVHDLAHLALPDIFGRGLKRLYARMLMKGVARKARSVIFISEFTQREFGRLVGPLRGTSTVIGNGVDAEWSNSSDVQKRGNNLLFVGNVKPHKNIVRLLEAYKNYRGRAVSKLLIVGNRSGFTTGLPREVMADLSSMSGVTFTGEVTDDALRGLYATAKALVFPSSYEGFGLPPLEAMAASCPVLVSDVASLPEVCGEAFNAATHRGNVLYFNPLEVGSITEALHRLDELTSAELAAMTRNAQRHAATKSWEITAAKTWEQLLKAVDEA